MVWLQGLPFRRLTDGFVVTRRTIGVTTSASLARRSPLAAVCISRLVPRFHPARHSGLEPTGARGAAAREGASMSRLLSCVFQNPELFPNLEL